MPEETKQLYHFTTAKYSLKAIRDRRLKAAELDKTNDLFEWLPYRGEMRESYQGYERCRRAMSLAMLCLSKTYKNPLLWGHYADKGKGVCLGFDVRIYDISGAFRQVFEVKYESQRLEPSSGYEICGIEFESAMIPWLNKGLVKFRGWEYEEEWRMYRKIDPEPDPVTGLYYFPFEDRLTLREILIGPHCEEENIKCRLERLTADYPDPKPEIIDTRLSLSTFEIEKLT